VKIQVAVFWVVMPCSDVGYRRFGGPCCFRHNAEDLDLNYASWIKNSCLFRYGMKFWFYEYLYTHLLGLLGPGIGTSQGLYLHRTAQRKNTQTYIPTSNGIQSQDPNYPVS